MLKTALIVSTCLALGGSVLAQSPTGAAQDGGEAPSSQPLSEALQILEAADEATKAVTRVSYDATFTPTGALASQQVLARGHLLKAAHETAGMLIHGEGWFYRPARSGQGKVKFVASWDGAYLRRVDPDRKIVIEATGGTSAQAVMGGAITLNMREYGHATPFQDEINGDVQALEGQTYVGDVLCNVIYIEYASQGPGAGQKARWYFGAEDNLPRRVERLQVINGRAGATVLSLYNVDTEPEIVDGAFTLEVPEDYEVRQGGGPVPIGSGAVPIGR